MEVPDQASFIRSALDTLMEAAGRRPDAHQFTAAEVAYQCLRVLAWEGTAVVSSASEEESGDGDVGAMAESDDPSAQPDSVNAGVAEVLAVMFQNRKPLFLALVQRQQKSVLGLFRQDSSIFAQARTTATLTLYIEEGLSYNSIDKLHDGGDMKMIEKAAAGGFFDSFEAHCGPDFLSKSKLQSEAWPTQMVGRQHNTPCSACGAAFLGCTAYPNHPEWP